MCLCVLFACGGDKAAEKQAPPAPAPAQAEKPGIDAAPGTPASKSGAPPWLVDAAVGKGACRDVDGGLDCSGSALAATREEGEKQALDHAMFALSDRIMPGAGVVVREQIEKVRGPNPDDVWWENQGAQLVVYVRVRLAADQVATVTSALGAIK